MDQVVTEIERAVGVGRDYDVRPDDSWVGVFERAGALEVCDSYGARFQLPHPVRFPIVRAVDFDRVVVVDSRPIAGAPGGYVYSMFKATCGGSARGLEACAPATLAGRRSTEPWSG